MSRRMWALAVAAWVGVVIAGSALTWIAINRAGDQVTGAQSATTAEPTVLSSAAATQTPTPPPTTAPVTPKPTAPAPRATTAGTPTPVATGAPVRPSATPTPKPPPPVPPRTETRTWTGASGFVTVACTGRLAQLRGASPGDGWTYEVGSRAGDSVEVKFAKGETEVDVHAQCVSGTPEFQVESGRD